MSKTVRVAMLEGLRFRINLFSASYWISHEQKSRRRLTNDLDQVFSPDSSSRISNQTARRWTYTALHVGSLIALCLLLCLSLMGCGGGYPGIDLIELKSTYIALDGGQGSVVIPIGAGNLPVMWSLSGATCTGSACGTLKDNGDGTITYTAPPVVTVPLQIVISGTLVGTTDTETVTITVNPFPTLNGVVPAGVAGTSYAATMKGSGGTGALTYSVSAGTLPPGLTLNAATGLISGTPTVPGTTKVTVKVTDSAPTPVSATADETIVITAAGAGLQIAAGTPPTGMVGQAYFTQVTANGGSGGYVYSIASGSLPPGLAISSTTGVISGSPTATGSYTFSAKATDSSNATALVALTINVLAPLALSSGTLPNGTVGLPYSSSIGVTGGTAPYTCVIASGTLPAGLSLGSACQIAGTPSAAGTVNLVVTATDSSNPVSTTTGPVSLTISPAGLNLSTGMLPAGTVGTPYSATIGVTGGTSPYSCTLTSGTLPAGLTLGAGCLVSGLPTVAGTANLTVKATDAANPAQTVTGPVSFTVNPAALSVTAGSLPNGTVGTAYNQTIPITGGTPVFSCTITSGTLPAGLTLGAGCVISGTPATAGTSSLAVKATDSGNPAQTAIGTLSITIDPTTLSLTAGPLPNGTVGTAYSQTIPVTGGSPTYNCTILSGTLPAGLTLGAGCLVSGTPTAAGTASLTVKATDSGSPAQTATGNLSITITPGPVMINSASLPSGTEGTSYSQTIPASGGTAPYSRVITSGTLPAGLTLGSGCFVSGIPTIAATVNMTVKVTDGGTPAQTATGPVSLTINPAPLVLTPGALASGTVNVLYNQTLPVSGGTSPYSCTVTSGTLPTGLALGAGCVINGTPAVAGTSTLVISVSDAGSPVKTASGTITLTINPAPLDLTAGALPDGTADIPYSHTLPIAGGTPPYNCVIVSGTLPAGLTLGAGCVVSGTPTVPGTANLTVKATDSSSPVQTATGALSLTIRPASLSITTGVLPNGTVNLTYNQALAVTGGTQPYTCSLVSGTLSAGLTMGSDCVVSGTPTTAGSATFTVKATDSSNPTQAATNAISLVINPAALSVTAGTLPNGTVGAVYSQTIPVAGGVSPYTCTITSGTLPAGLTLGAGCVVSGTPTAAGTVSLIVQATDSGTPPQTASGPVTLTINPANLSITLGALPDGTAGVAYNHIIPVNGGTSPYACTIVSGALPSGLTLDGTCVVSGTPNGPGTSNLTIRVTDNGNPQQSASGAISLTIKPANLSITVGLLPSGTVGAVYNQTIPVAGGTQPYTCAITQGTLPAGLALGSDCVVSGTPTAAGTSLFTVKATDSGNPAQIATNAISLTINPAPLTVTVGPLPNGTAGTPYNQTIPVGGGTPTYSCTVTAGTLPAGLTLGAGCVISGTPTVAGTANLTVSVADSGSPQQTTSGAVNITINPAALTLTTGALPNGTVGTAYAATVPVTGGTAPYTCSLVTGTLPAGLTLGGTCQVTGTPTAAGTATLTIKAEDNGSPVQSATGTVSLTVNPAPLVLTTGPLPSGTVGVVYSQAILLNGGTAPYSCTITSGTLQTGLALGSNCLITGTPTASGTVTLSVTATDSSNPAATASGTVTLLVNPSASLVITAPPAGTQSTPYTGAITVTNGTAPYSCSLTSGTLPAGLTLNANCTLAGTPTGSGTSTISVTATDSSTPVKTTTGTVDITINPGLTVGNPPAATVGSPYTGAIPVSGGTAPYTCSVAAGSSLPAGLTFGTGCTLTGTPTIQGITAAQVLVTDSANPPNTKTATVTVTVQPPATLTLAGTLPKAIVNQSYSQALTRTGGVGPYSYAVTSGALPAGLSLNASNGAISGTPTTVGASSFTITVTDSESTPQTASLPLLLQVIFAPVPNDVLLTGPYAFLFQGHDTVLVGTLAYRTATVGSFTADGNGLLTAGELDSNHQSSNPAGATIARNQWVGSYTLGSNLMGTMVVSTLNADGTVARNISYAITVKAAVSPATTSASGSLTESDTGLLTGQEGNGTFLQQTASSFGAGLTGSYAFGMQGDIVCFPACTANLQAGPVATVGQFATSTGTFFGMADTNLASNNYPTAALSGTFGAADTNGRVQMSMINPNIPNASYPVDFAVYMINANQAYVMSTDKHSAYMLLAGNMSSQTAPTFSNASLSGQFVGYENALTNPGLLGTTLQNVLNLSIASIFQGSSNGVGGCTTNYVDQGGTTAVVNTLTGLGGNSNLLTDLLGTYASTGTSNCTVATNGRAVIHYPAPSNTLTGLLALLGVTAVPPAPRVAYLTNTNTGYFLETGFAGLGSLERQTGQPFSLATLNGTYSYGTTPAVTAVTLNASGTFAANGAGAANYVLNEDVAAGGLNVVTLGVTGSGTYVVTDAQNGRYTFGTNVIFAINPNRFVLVDRSAANTSPSVALIQ